MSKKQHIVKIDPTLSSSLVPIAHETLSLSLDLSVILMLSFSLDLSEAKL